jgi:hypothetical protein
MKSHTHNNFLSYALILAAFFVILFFTKNIYANMQLELDMMEQNTLTHAREEAELTRLNQLKETLGAEGNELLEEISGFMGTFSDADMLEYIYSYAQQVNL